MDLVFVLTWVKSLIRCVLYIFQLSEYNTFRGLILSLTFIAHVWQQQRGRHSHRDEDLPRP